MEPSLSKPIERQPVRKRKGSKESKGVKIVLISIAILYLSLLLFVPLIAIFIKAFEQGVDVYLAAITESDALSAIKLTLLVAVIVVPLNTIFGIAAAWLVTKFHFKGKQLLLSIIELPFAVSPVIAGLVFVLLFSPRGVLGPWMVDHGYKNYFFCSRYYHCNYICDSPIRCSGVNSGNAGTRNIGRRGSCIARGQWMADVWPSYTSKY